MISQRPKTDRSSFKTPSPLRGGLGRGAFRLGTTSFESAAIGSRLVSGLSAMCACVMLLAAGCSNSDSGPETFPVTGSVTRGGQPVAGAVITFHPNDGGKYAQAYTDDAGDFDVSIYVGNETKRGMPAGEYAVSIEQFENSAQRSTMSRPKNLLPKKYASPQQSKLSAKVSADGPNEFQFKLD